MIEQTFTPCVFKSINFAEEIIKVTLFTIQIVINKKTFYWITKTMLKIPLLKIRQQNCYYFTSETSKSTTHFYKLKNKSPFYSYCFNRNISILDNFCSYFSKIKEFELNLLLFCFCFFVIFILRLPFVSKVFFSVTTVNVTN